MKILIVYAHPSKRSYTYQVLGKLVNELTRNRHNIEISDLYDMAFQTDMTQTEYDREAFADFTLPMSNDVIREHLKIEAADCIIFLYPVWWSDCPAKLKGWFDRVYAVGYAYGYDNSEHQLKKMKDIKLGHVICTAGHPNEFLAEIGVAESMRTVMLDDRLGKRFEHKEMTILGGTLNLESVRQIHHKKIIGIVKRLNSYFT